jgi:hypothetical protein
MNRLPCLVLASLLSACATSPSRHPTQTADPVSSAFQSADWHNAQTALAPRLRSDLRNGYLQFLNAMAYERQAAAGDRGALELAQVGYENALQFTPQNYWARLMIGFLRLDAGDADAAQEHFAAAALDQPQRWEAFYGLGVASYYRQDAAVLQLAADRALRLAPDQPDVMRLAAFARAVQGDESSRALAQDALRHTVQPPDHDITLRRVDQLLTQAAARGDGSFRRTAEATEERPEETAPPQQMVVDVTILLSSVVDARNRGINLFDGLRMQYGYENRLQRRSDSREDDLDTTASTNRSRAITSVIGIPQLNYNLNLFNDANQTYGVIARPSLTAYLGSESEFFAGRTINVAVSGVNLGDLQPVDVGVRLKLSPDRIGKDTTRFRIRAARSFLSRGEIGNFQQSLTTFQQFVEATSELRFGQTLILSALSETVNDANSSKVPVIGDIPGVNTLFNARTAIRRQESLVILVTPSLPTAVQLPADPTRRREGVQDLLRWWGELIEPNTDVKAIVERLEALHMVRKPKPGDLRVRPSATDSLIREAVQENLRMAALTGH